MPTLLHKSDASPARAVSRLAAEPALASVLQWFSSERRWINERHLELCRIAAPTFQEQRRAEWMVAQFQAMGCDARIDKAGNVIAYPRGNQDGPLVALTAHLDTVLEPINPEDIRPGRDGQLHGPGVSDNGAGLAALLAIAQAVCSSSALLDSPLPIVFIANVGEEGEGNLSGMRYICRPGGLASRIAAFVVLDGPTVEHITCRALASRRFEVTMNGPGGHSWSDHGTANPVHALSRAIAWFCEHPAALTAPSGPRVSYNFGLIEGGTSVNSIPTLARAKVDLRSESSARLDELATLLTVAVEHALESENDRAAALFAGLFSSPGRLTAKIREIGSRPGGHLSDDAPLLRHLRAVDAHLGIRAKLDRASTDANVPLSLGIPAVSIGAGGQGGGAHTPGEWFHADGREKGLRRIFLTLCLLMRDINPAAAAARLV
ncbi:MAG: M20/M25/M40 family metallo-hydrolase [Acidobacteria bacterium]|nr:M20/M25/M40 family metallo-hydrolase [Acidobacteriota bacterium]